VNSRITQFRAAFLLVASSASLFWVVGFWLPLPEYLGVVNSARYADYQTQLKIVVFTYLLFCLLNLVSAGLFQLKLNSKLKFWLALGPAALVLLTPLLSAATVLPKAQGKNYFEVVYGFYQLLRFGTIQTFVIALVFTLVAVALNVYVAFRAAKGSIDSKVPLNLRNRYLIYAGIFTLITSLWVINVAITSSYRNQDRASCYDYGLLELPTADAQVAPFLNEVQLDGENAGNEDLQLALTDLANISRQYFSLLNTDVSDSDLEPYKVALAAARGKVVELCAPFVTE